MDSLKAVEGTIDLNTDQLIVGWKCSSPAQHLQREQSDYVARFTIQETERRKAAQTADYMY